ncbi:MAG: F0F1 ATP synthase subunit delta [Gammaproteobacteria bacterium]|nr:F0F1 ATP synthase subunit delta [Gammaproteobacteria bacterium]
MSNVARPYAKAAFETAKENQCLDLWAEALQQLATVVENKDVVSFLHNPQLEQRERNDVFLGVLECFLNAGAGDGADKSLGAADGGHPVKPGDDFGNKEIEGAAQNIKDAHVGAAPRGRPCQGQHGINKNNELWNFLRLLSQNGRLELLPLIYQQFTILKREAENKIQITITSALELTASEKKELENKLAGKLQKTVVTNFVIDTKLIGGLKVSYGDRVLDASLLNSLKNLRHKLLL